MRQDAQMPPPLGSRPFAGPWPANEWLVYKTNSLIYSNLSRVPRAAEIRGAARRAAGRAANLDLTSAVPLPPSSAPAPSPPGGWRAARTGPAARALRPRTGPATSHLPPPSLRRPAGRLAARARPHPPRPPHGGTSRICPLYQPAGRPLPEPETRFITKPVDFGHECKRGRRAPLGGAACPGATF